MKRQLSRIRSFLPFAVVARVVGQPLPDGNVLNRGGGGWHLRQLIYLGDALETLGASRIILKALLLLKHPLQSASW